MMLYKICTSKLNIYFQFNKYKKKLFSSKPRKMARHISNFLSWPLYVYNVIASEINVFQKISRT